MSRVYFTCTFLACTACGVAGGPADGGLDGGLAIIAEPASPEAPRGGCPTGWGPFDAVHPSCVAYLDGFDTCGDAEAQLPGTSRCAPIGRACGLAAFADPPATGRAIYVAVGGSGDGSLAAPFGTLAEAVSAAVAGDTILLSRGRFEITEELTLDRILDLRGVCPGESIVHATTPGGEGDALLSVEARVRLFDLTLSGPRHGVWVELSGLFEAHGVAFVDLGEFALVIDGDAIVEDSVLRMTDDARAGAFNGGIDVRQGAHLTLQRSELRGFRDAAFIAEGIGTVVTMQDSVLGSRFDIDDNPHGGRIADITGRAEVHLTRVVIDGADTVGLFIEDPGTEVDLEDIDFSGVAGEAVYVRGGPHVTATRANVAACLTRGFTVFGPDSVLTIEDSYVSLMGVAGDLYGTGIEVQDAELHVSRTVVHGNESAGISAFGSQVFASDVRIEDIGFSEPTMHGTPGFYLEQSDATLERIDVSDVEVIAFAVFDSTMTLRDVSIDHITATELGGSAFGILSVDSVATLERARVTDTTYVGIASTGPTSRLDVSDLVVTDMHAWGCLDEACSIVVGGIGVVAYEGATIGVRRFSIARSELAGGQIAFGEDEAGGTSTLAGQLDLEDGLFEGNLVAVSVQVPDYDYDRLTRRVVFRDNVRTIAADELPIAKLPTF